MWRTEDVTAWTVDSTEPRGLREKRWLRDPAKEVWLFKRPRASRPTEPAIEWFVLALARAVGIDAAEGVVAIDRTDGEQRGTLVKRFFDPTQAELISGDAVLSADPSYTSARRELHTLPRALSAVSALGSVQVERLVAVLALDAWTGNADRHQGNWSLLEARSGVRQFSTMYDPATCLGVELQDKHPFLRASPSGRELDAYCDKCPSGWGDGATLIRMKAVIAELGGWDAWRATAPAWIARFESALGSEVPRLLDEVPSDWWPTPRKELARVLLLERLRMLKASLPTEETP